MNIEQIDVDLLSSTSKSYTVRASVSSGAFRAQAISKGKSLVEAEEEAIKRAELRLKEHVGKEINAAETTKEAIKRAELTTENPVKQEEKTKTPAVSPPEQFQDSELKVEKKEAKQEPPQTTPEQQPDEQQPNSAPQSSPDHDPQPREEKSNEEEEPSLLADTRERLLAKEQLQKIGLSLTKAEFAAAFQPNNWRTTPTAILEKWAQQFEDGIPEPESHQVEKLCKELQQAQKLDSLKKSWSKIIALHWSGFAPPSRLELWRAKEEAKEKIAKTTQRIPQTQPASGTRTSCKSCNATIEWVSTKSGKSHPVDPLSRPVYLEGEGKGKGEKRFVWLDGVAQLVDTWPAPPGVGDAHMSYQSHFATCPHANKHRRQGK